MRLLCIPALLLLAASVLSGVDAVTDEQYAIYSAVLANIQFSRADHNQRLLIVRDTFDPRKLPIPAKECQKVIDEIRRSHREPSEFARRLEDNKLVIGRPYVLIAAQMAEEWEHEHFSPKIPTDPPNKERPSLFPGSTDLIRISSILFNANKTRGLVYVSTTCGTLCGLSGWNIVEKTQSGWSLLSTPNCETIN